MTELTFTPMDVPPKKRGRKSQYKVAIEQLMTSNKRSGRISGGASIESMYAGFKRAITEGGYEKSVTVSRVDGAIYIEKI
jgi:hypothetical protein